MGHHPLHRTVVAVDVQGFSSRPNPAQQCIREALPGYLAAAFQRAGIDWTGCTYGDRGDGALIVLPPGADTVPVVKPMPDLVAAAIREHNGHVDEQSRFAVRMAVNVGSVHDDDRGHTGMIINETARILDAAPLRRAVSRTGAPLAVAVSESVYRGFVVHGYDSIDPTAYIRCRVSVKNVRTMAWVHVPFAHPDRVRRELRKPARIRLAGAIGIGVAGSVAVVGLVLATDAGSTSADHLFVDVPRGGGWGAVDDGLRSLKVCDTSANGRGVRVEYLLDGSREVRSFGDRNGSAPPCYTVRSEIPVVSLRVCESDEGGGHDLCSDWVEP